MAKKMSYADTKTGFTFPDSIWVPYGIFIDASNNSCRIEFLGYASLAALGQKKAPVGTKSYSLTMAQFAQFGGMPAVGETNFEVIMNACYAIAAEIDDVVVNPNDLSLNENFFKDATDVVLA